MKNKSFAESLYHAVSGTLFVVRSERNMKIHIAMTIAVIVCAVLFGLTSAHKAIVISLCALVIFAEHMNTAIESIVDMLSPEFNMYAKYAKDAAAGAVLVVSVGAAVSGLIIFVPYAVRMVF